MRFYQVQSTSPASTTLLLVIATCSVLLADCSSGLFSRRSEVACPADLACPQGALCYCYRANQTIIEDVDRFGNGILDWRTVYTYDTSGLRLWARRDLGLDGSYDEVWSYVYDADARLVLVELDRGDDGTINLRYHYDYDDQGNRVSAEVDDGADQTINRRIHYTYDAAGNCLSEAIDRNGDGVFNARYHYTYDEQGHRLTDDYDLGADGALNRRCRYDPPCPPPFSHCSRPICEDRPISPPRAPLMEIPQP